MKHAPISDCRAARSVEPRHVIQKAWTDDETDRLCDMIADGWTFGAAARKLGRSRNSCIGRWHNYVIPKVGAQAR